jgi:hypothetical protein
MGCGSRRRTRERPAMSTVTIEKAKLEQALDLLRYARSVASFERNSEMDSFIATMQALAAQPAVQPVAWYEHNPDLDAWFLAYTHNPKVKSRPLVFGDATPPAAQPEPVPEGSVSKGEFNRLRDDYNDLVNRSQQDAKDATRWRKHVNHCQLQGVDLDYQITTPPAAQPAVPKLEPVALRDALAGALSSVYVCGRVWDAWSVGTMTEDDFQPAAECDEVLDSLVEAIAKATPPAAQPAVPMTDEQAKQLLKDSDLLEMFENIGWYSAPLKGFNKNGLALIRAIEAAHGITKGQP